MRGHIEFQTSCPVIDLEASDIIPRNALHYNSLNGKQPGY